MPHMSRLRIPDVDVAGREAEPSSGDAPFHANAAAGIGDVVIRPCRSASDRDAVARLCGDPTARRHPARGRFTYADDRLWVADYFGRVVGVIGVNHIDHHVAQVRRLAVTPAFAHSDLPAQLLKVALRHCRHLGDLKLVLDSDLDPNRAVATCSDNGFQYARQRRRREHTTLEFYLNLYQSPPAAKDADHLRPGTGPAPRPPLLHADSP